MDNRAMSIKKPVVIFLTVVSVMSFSCVRRPEMVMLKGGHYYVDPTVNFANVGKVVVVEFGNHSSDPEFPGYITEAVAEALQKQHLFTVRTVHPVGNEWQRLDLGNVMSLEPKELVKLRDELNADAIVFGSITQYYPYPHLLTAMNLKMVDLRRVKLVWAMEQVWDSSDRNVELRMKQYSRDEMRGGYKPLDWQLMIMSPRAFNKFVASEIAETFSWGSTGNRLQASAATERKAKYVR
jgi:hypothetical protein